MEGMLKFFIIHHFSGMCIFDQTFEDLQASFESDIVSGYLYAIFEISREVAGEKTRMLQLENVKFVYNISDEFIMITLAKSEMDGQFLEAKLNLLQTKFQESYKHYFLDGFSGNITPFQKFAKVVEDAFEIESQYFQIVEKRQEQLREFFSSAQAEWQSLHEIFAKKAKMFGAWITNTKHQIDKSVIHDIIETRKHHELSEQDDRPIKRKNSWV